MKPVSLPLVCFLAGALAAAGVLFTLGAAAPAADQAQAPAPQAGAGPGRFEMFPAMLAGQDLLMLDTSDGTLWRAQYNERADRFDYSRVSDGIPQR